MSEKSKISETQIFSGSLAVIFLAAWYFDVPVPDSVASQGAEVVTMILLAINSIGSSFITWALRQIQKKRVENAK